MEKAVERVLLVLVVVAILAVPLFVWWYEEKFIPSRFGPDVTVVRLYVTRDIWTTDRINAVNYSWKEFEPAAIALEPGQKTILRIISGDVYHGFGFKTKGRGGIRINETVSPGQLTTVELTIDKEGKYRFSCTVECGKEHSDLIAEFVVTDPET
jgi:heme/copper-type cytochrome/quinol oxidase subunit 2